MTTVTHYSIYCITESAAVLGYSVDPPTVCYNNATHTVNPDSIQIIADAKQTSVMLVDENIPTGGNHQTKGFVFTAVPGPNNYDTVFPYPVNLFNVRIQNPTVGDIVDCLINPNYSLGTSSLTADVAIGDTVLTVSPDILTKVYIGLEIVLTDGTNTDFLSEIVAIDNVLNTVTVTTATSHAFVKTATVIKTNLYVVRNYMAGLISTHDFSMKTGGQYVPAGVVIRLAYNNANSTDESVGLSIQYAF